MKVEMNKTRGHFDKQSLSRPCQSTAADFKPATSELGQENEKNLLMILAESK